MLGLGTLVGFVVAFVLQRAGLDGPARLVDPAMVVLTSLLYLRVPLRLAGEGLREVLTLSAAPDVGGRVAAAVAGVERAYELGGSAVRTSKVGPRLDVDVVFLVGPGSRARTVEDFDAVRDALLDALAGPGPAPSLSVGFTARPALLA